MWNPKNNLQEFVQNIGYSADCISYEVLEKSHTTDGRFYSFYFKVRVKVCLNMDVTIIKDVEGNGELISQNDAAMAAFEELRDNYPAFCVDWKKVYSEAQAGDALIKLAAYLTDELKDIEAKSRWLQRVESDPNLEAIFNRLYKEQDPSVAMFGKNLGKKHKSSWIESLIWRWFSDKGLPLSLTDNLKAVYDFLDK